jgi:hypothetical protein
MRGEAEVHQANAVKSWKQLGCEIILYGEEADALARELGVEYRQGVDRESGIPRLDSLFRLAQKDAGNDIVGYMNADVVIVEGLAEAVEKVSAKMPRFLMVCRRWDIDLDEPLPFDGNWRAIVRRRIAEKNELHSDCSSDLFLFKRPLWDVLPFTPGRPEWDNWMLWRACDTHTPVVDVTPGVVMAHPNHGYGDDGMMDVRDFWRTAPLVERNRSLGGSGKQFCFRHVRAVGNLWTFDGGLHKV